MQIIGHKAMYADIINTGGEKMDFNHCDVYNHLLTRKCSCGGDPEMIIDFVDNFEARCSRCHRSTHTYMKPEDAAKHWNDGDDIMDRPLNIFWDDPKRHLQGEVVAIHIADDEFEPVTQQSINFGEAIIEYTDKKLRIEHDNGTINIGRISSFNPDQYRYTIRPSNGETIKFDNIILEDDRVVRLEYRWNDSWLSIVAEQHNLVIAKDIVPYGEESPSIDGEYPLI